MEVREARPSDAASIARVARASWHAAYDEILGADRVDALVDEWYDPDAIAEQVDVGAFVVCEVRASEADPESESSPGDRRVVGFAHAGEGDGRLELIRLYVHPERWGDGCGRALLSSVASAFDPERSLYAVVLAENDVGRSFYDACGFETVERRTSTLAGRDVEEILLRARVGTLVD